MLREMWRLLRNFLHDFSRTAARGTREHWKGIVIFCSVSLVVLIALMVAVLKATASPRFCGTCHNMTAYIESWQGSSHKKASCLECHFEPGVWGELKGKWKAQTHIVMKITGTAPSRPHTQISDASCLREGCHSTAKLSEKQIVFKGVGFSHSTHLGDLRRGKKLRCVSCHSQIVQGEHLTVTESTCFICHFYERDNNPGMADCKVCHVQTKAKIFIDANENLPFVHKDYLDRGVLCGQCHFDVVFGDGHQRDNTCVQCHAEPKLLKDKHTAEQIHTNHVTLHKVECFRCHTAIEHRIVRPSAQQTPENKPREIPTGKAAGKPMLAGYHYDTDCIKCHTLNQHEVVRLMYMGTGATEVQPLPSPMYLAHADCGSCHIALRKTSQGQEAILRFQYEETVKSCSDCHGKGYDVMARHWKELLTEELSKTQNAMLAIRKELSDHKSSVNLANAVRLVDVAEKNLIFVRNGRGLHNMDYALKVLADCRERAEKALALIVPQYKEKPVDSPSGCTQLCHSCVECIEPAPVNFGNIQFPHEVHVKDENLDCLECHSPRQQHGRTFLKNCNSCHHGAGVGAVACQDCHVENFNLYNGQNACDERNCDVRGAPNPMVKSVTCQECHSQIPAGTKSTVEGIKTTCVECHDGKASYGAMVDEWKSQAKALGTEELDRDLQDTQRMVLAAIRRGQYTYDAQDLLNNAEKNLRLITKGNPLHNIEFSKDLATRVKALLAQARKTLQTHSTVRTLAETEYR